MIIDLHVHTSPRSEDSDVGPEEIIRRAKETGLDGLCFTEHDWHWTEEEVCRLSREFDFPVFRGMEISSDEGHLLVYGLNEYKFGMHHAGVVRKLVDEVGGVMILAHPYRRQVKYNSNPGQLLDSVLEDPIFGLVDAVEVLNGGSNDRENSFAMELCRRLGLRGVAGSDGHAFSDVPSFATEFERRIETLDELLAELREGRFKPLDLRPGTLHTNR